MATPMYDGEYEREAPEVSVDPPTVPDIVLQERRNRREMENEAWVERIVGDCTLEVGIPEGYVFNSVLFEELAVVPDKWCKDSRKDDRPPPPVFKKGKINYPDIVYAAGVMWDVGDKVGEGAFGSVYEIEHRGPTDKRQDRLVKFVTVKGGERNTRNRLEFIWNEVGAAMAAGDYLCSEIIQEENGDTMLALVMEKHAGKDMGRQRNERLLSETHPLDDTKWMYQLAVALRSVVATLRKMHSQGWIHRDVKPSNVMIPDSLEEAMLAHLIDYGTAERSGNVRTGPRDTIVGTPHYVLPEAYENKDVDLRLRDYWAAMVSVARASGFVGFAHTEGVWDFANKLLEGRFFIAPDLSTQQKADEFFLEEGKEQIEGAHREFIQWLHDFLQPNLPYAQRLEVWERDKVVVTQAPHVKMSKDSESFQWLGSFLDDDKFVRELEGRVEALAAQAGIEMPKGMLERFQEF